MIDVPLWAYKLIQRVLHVVNGRGAASFRLFRIDGVWYLQVADGQPERLGD